MDHPALSFEQYSADRLEKDRDQITRDWVETLSAQLDLDPVNVLPHPGLLDHIPDVLSKAAEFLLVPDPEKLRAEQLVTDEMREIAVLRQGQGWQVHEVVREFDELAQLLDRTALRWIDDYPSTPDPRSVGRVFGRLNRVPLLMGQILVRVLEGERIELLRQLAAAEEEERSRLSRELHDHVGQLLTALLLDLGSLEREPGGGDRAPRIRELETLVNVIAHEVHQLALDLRPPALELLGLPRALENLVEEWSERTGVRGDFHSVGLQGERFAPETEIALYRVTQEALNNVLKHAGATQASVIIELRQRSLRLVVEDDGIGFDEATLTSPDKARRLGVRGMRERVSRVGGVLEIESSPGSGTTLFVRISDAIALSRSPGE